MFKLIFAECYNFSMDGEQFQVLPEQPTPQRARRKLVVALAIVIVVVVAVMIGLWFNSTSTMPITLSERQIEINQALAELKNAQPPSQADIQSALRTISESKTKVTATDVTSALNQIKASQRK